MMAQARLLHGTDEMPPTSRGLVAGKLSAELEGGNLRYVRFAGVEVMRAISFLVRSRAWATIEPRIADLTVSETTDSFQVTYRATVRDGDARLDYWARIDGMADGALTFRCDIEAATDFETCRTGFVVLHPASVAGQPVRIEHTDGRRVAGAFPRLIDPVQPMRDLRALTHEAAPGVTVTCRMDGDAFEMEDQRNWTDASFKTYVRPLALPWPYVLAAGSRCEQAVTLQVACAAPLPVAPTIREPIRIEIGEAIGTMPPIGLGCTPDEARAALPHASQVARAGISALVCRFDPGQGHDAADLAAFRDLAAACGSRVELQVVVHSVSGYAAELIGVAEAVRACGLALSAMAVSPAPDLKSVPPGQPWPECAPLDGLYAAARTAFPGISLGGGTFAYFTELNRKRPPVELLDFVTFSTSPLVHAADDRSVMESLDVLPSIAESARAIARGKPFVVGPSAIGMRDNPYGPAPLPNPGGARLAMSGCDPRQRCLFNAAWTLGYIARLAAGGAARIAVSAPVGAFGIMDADGAFPVFQVIRGCAALHGAALHAAPTTRERDVLALLAATSQGRELWLANLTPETQTVALPGTFQGADLQCVDAQPARAMSAEQAGSPVRLAAYAVVRCRAAGSRP